MRRAQTRLDPEDRPHVIVWPPLLAFAALGFGFVLDRIVPIGLMAQLPQLVRTAAGLGVLLIAAILGIAGIRAFLQAKTHVEPWKPATKLVDRGIYGRTRNPMYLGLGLATLAFAITNSSDWTAIMIVPAAVVLHFGVVLREERYLAAKFGDAYRRYCEGVPRYGWRFGPG
jgi:protein-S-isoprenylcysteine O-methyltransferase Ste14